VPAPEDEMPSAPRAPRAIPPDVWAVAALTLLAVALRFPTLASQSYWADEALTSWEVHQHFGSMLTAVAHNETTPPLYFILAWAWVHVLGPGEAALRSLSAVAGVAVVPIGYLCGRELVSRRAGVIAAAFAALSPFLIWYSQEARSYMLLIALSGASFLFFIRSRRDPAGGNVAGWGVFSALALATHFFAGFLIAPEALWLLWRARNRAVAITAAALVVVQVSLLPLAMTDTAHGVGWIHKEKRVTRIAQVASEFSVSTVYRHVTTPQALWGAAIVVGVAVVLLLVAGGSRERRGALAAATIAALVIGAPLLLGIERRADDFFIARNVSAAWIPIAVALGAACSAPRWRDGGMIVATALLVMFAVGTFEIETNPVFQRADWRSVGHAIGAAVGTRAILVDGGQEALALQVYTKGVSWAQPPDTRKLVFDEVAVVGSISRAPLRKPKHARAAALPRTVPNGAIFLGRRWVHNFEVAWYALPHPWRVDTLWLAAAAGRFFKRVPGNLLVLVQHGRPGVVPIPVELAPAGLAPFALGPSPYPHALRRHRRHPTTGRAGPPHGGPGRGIATDRKLTRGAIISRQCWMEVARMDVAVRRYACLRARSRH
jgi:hypothetical protein